MVFISGWSCSGIRPGDHRPLPGGRTDRSSPAAPSLPPSTSEFAEVDHFVLNEAELTLPRFLADLEAGRSRSASTATTDLPTSADTPIPAGSWPTCRRYATDEHPVLPRLSVRLRVLQRHGPVRSPPAHQDRRRRSSPNSTRYAPRLARRGVLRRRQFHRQQAQLKEELLPALIDWQQGRRGDGFHTEASINLADDAELTELMVEAGFDTVFIGIETPGRGEPGRVQQDAEPQAATWSRTSNACSAPAWRCRAGSSSASTATPPPFSSARSSSSSRAAS